MRTAKIVTLLTTGAVLAGVLASAGCVVGGWKSDLPRLNGALAVIGNPSGEFQGEMLFVRDDGIVAKIGNRIVLSRWLDMTRLSFPEQRVARLEHGRRPRYSEREAMRRASRYPYGITDAQLAALLASVGQTELEILRQSGDAQASRSRHPPVAATDPRASVRPPGAAAEAFIMVARTTAARYESRDAAIRDGFVRVGPDFPGMGEHWVQPGRIVDGRLDPGLPPVLSYAMRGGTPVLLGMAWALPLGPGEAPPAEPFGAELWHDHSNAVDEEVLLIRHAGGKGDPPPAFRLAMVHIWTGLPNPDGILAQNNWSLPWWRNGLPVPDRVSRKAARAASLAGDGRAFYRELLERAVDLTDDQRARVVRALDAHAARAEMLIAMQRATAVAIDPAEYERIWTDFWLAVRDAVPSPQWARLAPFAEGV